jgi:hypothetical protein
MKDADCYDPRQEAEQEWKRYKDMLEDASRRTVGEYQEACIAAVRAYPEESSQWMSVNDHSWAMKCLAREFGPEPAPEWRTGPVHNIQFEEPEPEKEWEEYEMMIVKEGMPGYQRVKMRRVK